MLYTPDAYGPPTLNQWQADIAPSVSAAERAGLERSVGMITYSPWTQAGPTGVTYGFGARDWRGNRWNYHGTIGGELTRTLVRAAGEDSEAEKLRAAAAAILLGQDITTPEERAWAQQCNQRAAELEGTTPSR